MNEEVKNGKFKTLDMLHHFTSGLKSIYSQMCYDGIDLIRQNCGGAGFSAWSGLPQQYYDYSPVPTYEGDNTVMAQQTFNYIEKKLAKIAKGVPAPGIFKYLNDIEKLCSLKSDVKTVDQFLDIQHLENALAVKASFSVRDMVLKMQNSKEKRIVKVNDLFAADLVQTTRAHMMYLSFFMFKYVVDTTEFKSNHSKDLLYLLAKIYALKQLTIDCTACYETGFFTAGSKGLLMEAMKKALIELRPHMIPLVELNSDELIDKSSTSAIGNKWGDIYEAMLERAMQSRLNAKPKPDYWDNLVKPLIKADYSAHL